MKYWSILLIVSLGLAVACSRDKVQPQLNVNNVNNDLQQLQAEQQKRAAEQSKAQAQAQAEEQARIDKGVGWLMARHGRLTVRGILAKDTNGLKDEFSTVVKTYLQHGKDFDGHIVDDSADLRREVYTPALGSEVQAALSRPAQPGSTLVAGLASCLADIEVDESCLDSSPESETADAYSKKLLTFVCHLNRDFHLRINPMLVRRMIPARAEGQSPAGTLLRGRALSGNQVENIILCGPVRMADYSMVSAVAANVILKNFFYEMNGNYGYGLFEVGTDQLVLLGNNRLEAKAREGGQVDPPAIHLEVGSKVNTLEDANLDIISLGADLTSSSAAGPAQENSGQD